jgi:uncharacterized protein (TIGR02145 family)
MVTGEKPYDTKTLSNFQLQMKIVQEELPKTNTNWDKIIEKATHKKSENRLQSCNAILEGSNVQNTISENLDFRERTLIFSEEPTIYENKDDKESSNVKIGNQVWMVENLNVDKFRNGEPIPEAKTVEEWVCLEQNKQPAWCYYDNDPANGEKYGKLYNWYAVNDPRGLAPEGWKIASDRDWSYMEVDFEEDVEKKTNISHTEESLAFKNKNSFFAFPSGYRNFYAAFLMKDKCFYWWTSSMKDEKRAISRSIEAGKIIKRDFNMSLGFSVRCIKD